MGYTHYWKNLQGRAFSAEQWTNITRGTIRVIQAWEMALDYKLALDRDEPNKRPEITAEQICFNGIGADGYETFMFDREPEFFEFCKTAQRPYDDVVTAVLILANHYAPEVLTITSDGEPAEWSAGLALARLHEETAELPFQQEVA